MACHLCFTRHSHHAINRQNRAHTDLMSNPKAIALLGEHLIHHTWAISLWPKQRLSSASQPVYLHPLPHPVHKKPAKVTPSIGLTAASRYSSYPHFSINTREMESNRPRYTLETLQALRAQYQKPFNLHHRLRWGRTTQWHNSALLEQTNF